MSFPKDLSNSVFSLVPYKPLPLKGEERDLYETLPAHPIRTRATKPNMKENLKIIGSFLSQIQDDVNEKLEKNLKIGLLMTR
jgi:hypothetical protein